MWLKRIFIAAFLLYSLGVQAQTDSLFAVANEAYKQKNYQNAIHSYSDLVSLGYQSPTLYYNIGNAYFKSEQLAKSILWYERALRLAPSNEDILHNLAFANNQIIDEMDVVPEFFLKKWIRSLYNLMSSNGWAIASILFSLLMFTLLAFLLLSSHARTRILLFFSTLLMVLLLIASISFAVIQNKQIHRTDQAIIMPLSVTVKSMPDEAGTDLFTVHEGLKVNILEKVGDWIEVEFPNGNKGWIQQLAVEHI